MLGRKLEEPVDVRALDVEQAPDLARVAPRRERRLVDRAVGRADVLPLEIAERRQPAVGLAPVSRSIRGL